MMKVLLASTSRLSILSKPVQMAKV